MQTKTKSCIYLLYSANFKYHPESLCLTETKFIEVYHFPIQFAKCNREKKFCFTTLA